MKIRFFIVVMILCAGILFAGPARADLDQRCLSECVSSGSPSSTCMPGCTYNLKTVQSQQPIAPGMMMGQDHKLLQAPVPSGDLLLSPDSVGKSKPTKDYNCTNQCTKDGWQYNLCEQRCMKRQCGPGDQHCRDLTGASGGSFAPAH